MGKEHFTTAKHIMTVLFVQARTSTHGRLVRQHLGRQLFAAHTHTAQVLKHIIQGLEDPADGVRGAGALCVMALSRSVKTLREYADTLTPRKDTQLVGCEGPGEHECSLLSLSGKEDGRAGSVYRFGKKGLSKRGGLPCASRRSSLLDTDVAQALCKLLTDSNPDVQVRGTRCFRLRVIPKINGQRCASGVWCVPMVLSRTVVWCDVPIGVSLLVTQRTDSQLWCAGGVFRFLVIQRINASPGPHSLQTLPVSHDLDMCSGVKVEAWVASQIPIAFEHVPT
eukprot:1161048-Pelagomonas_calceolata.AAC.5